MIKQEKRYVTSGIMLLICSIALILILTPDVKAKADAKEIGIKYEKLFFENSETDFAYLTNEISADTDKFVTIDYGGADYDNVCGCNNEVCIIASLTYINKQGTKTTDTIFSADFFNWYENRRIVVFLPNFKSQYSGSSPYYRIYICRIHSSDHNKGGLDKNGYYDTTLTHKDRFIANVYSYNVNKIGLESSNMRVGEKAKAIIDPVDYIGYAKWKTDNTSVLLVDENGFVTAINSGFADLQYAIDDNIVFEQGIFVDAIDNPDDIELFEDERCLIPSYGLNENIVWESKNSEVAIVENGEIIAKNEGKAVITGKYYNHSLLFNVKVKSREIIAEGLPLYMGGTADLSVSGPAADVIWTIDNNKIATIDKKGKVTAIQPGTVNVTAQVGNRKMEFVLEVLTNSLSESNISLYSGQKRQIYITETKNVVWKSSNKKIATVKNGMITAVKPGVATITAEIGGEVLECTVNVLKSKLSFDEKEVMVGEYIYINVIGAELTPELISSKSSCVTVLNDCLIATSAGKATITVKVGKEKLKCKITVRKWEAPTGIRYTSSINTIKLEWDPVYSADSYSVYLYDKGKKTYELLGNTKSTQYNVKKLEPNTVYAFKLSVNVKANGTVTEQKVSEKVECKTLENINGWKDIDGKRYYYKKGVSVGQGLMVINKEYYIFDENGALIRDRITSIDSKMYYSDSNGIVACDKEVTDKDTGLVYIADSNGVLSVKPFVPTLKNTSDYKVVESYKYRTSYYEYLVYVVEAKRTIDVELKLTIKDKKGNIYDTCSDSISLSSGKKNVFILQTEIGLVDYSYNYSFNSRSFSTIWSGSVDAVKVTQYNVRDNKLYITLKQTKSGLGSFAELKVLLFKNGSLVYADDYYYSVYAPELNYKGDEGVMDISVYGKSFDKVVFYYEDR